MRPGLYVATVRGVEGVRVVMDDPNGVYVVSTRSVDQFITHPLDKVTDARPLVVLDPESDEDCDGFGQAMYAADGNTMWATEGEAVRTAYRARARSILRALAAPTPAEPMGLGAVVRDRGDVLWIRVPERDADSWYTPGRAWAGWSEIDVAEVLTEGWSA